jgi:hypothetical protein
LVETALHGQFSIAEFHSFLGPTPGTDRFVENKGKSTNHCLVTRQWKPFLPLGLGSDFDQIPCDRESLAGGNPGLRETL